MPAGRQGGSKQRPSANRLHPTYPCVAIVRLPACMPKTYTPPPPAPWRSVKLDGLKPAQAASRVRWGSNHTTWLSRGACKSCTSMQRPRGQASAAPEWGRRQRRPARRPGRRAGTPPPQAHHPQCRRWTAAPNGPPQSTGRLGGTPPPAVRWAGALGGPSGGSCSRRCCASWVLQHELRSHSQGPALPLTLSAVHPRPPHHHPASP